MTTLVDAPARADGVQLIGEMVGSGYRTPPSLVRRGDGQILQLTPLLYLVLEATDGRRSYDEIAEVVEPSLGRSVSADNVATLVDEQLRPLGLLKADGSEPELKAVEPAAGPQATVAVTDPRTTHRITDPFRVLFRPVVVAIVLIGFVAVIWWVFFDQGLGASAYDAFERPGLLLLVFVVTGALRRLPRVRARRRGALRRRRARGDGRRALPGVAGVLHRRHRQLPARPRRAGSAPTSAASTSTRSSRCSPSCGGGPPGGTRCCWWSPPRSCR